MSKRKVVSIIGMVLMAFLIGNMFLPLISNGDFSYSFWKYLDQMDANEVNIIVLVELIIGLLVFLLQLCGAIKETKFVYFPIGYYLTYHVVLCINLIRREVFQYASIGLYLGLIVSTIVLILVIIGNRLSNESKPKYYGYSAPKFDPQTGEPIFKEKKPISYDPQTGKPIYEKAKKIVGYNPNTGEPIYK